MVEVNLAGDCVQVTAWDCPLCVRGERSRAEAARAAEQLAHRSPTDANKRAARLARACFEPLSVRESQIWFLCQAQSQRPEGEMDLSLFGMGGDSWGDTWLEPKALARKLAAEKVRLDGDERAWWITENMGW